MALLLWTEASLILVSQFPRKQEPASHSAATAETTDSVDAAAAAITTSFSVCRLLPVSRFVWIQQTTSKKEVSSTTPTRQQPETVLAHPRCACRVVSVTTAHSFRLSFCQNASYRTITQYRCDLCKSFMQQSDWSVQLHIPP